MILSEGVLCVRISDRVKNSTVRKYDSAMIEADNGNEAWRFLLKVLKISVHYEGWPFCAVLEL